MKQSRMTRQKQMILDIALAHHDHPTADQIYAEVREADGRISRGTVYRNLEQLSAAGILLHVKLPGADRFDCRLDRHYHLICRSCGTVLDAPADFVVIDRGGPGDNLEEVDVSGLALLVPAVR